MSESDQTQKEVSQGANLDMRTVARLRQNDNRRFNTSTLIKLYKYFNLSKVSDLLTLSNN
jgi:hypothetical protein